MLHSRFQQFCRFVVPALFVVFAGQQVYQQRFSGSTTSSAWKGLLGSDSDHIRVGMTDASNTTHRVLYSRTTQDGNFFSINSRDHELYNANILPHPTMEDHWIVVAQRNSKGHISWYFSEIYCVAAFQGGELTCLQSPLTLTIPATPAEKCEGTIALLGNNIGPHDARVIPGPEFPIVLYGSNSAYTCMGQFALDLRTLMDWKDEPYSREQFRFATELQRPPPVARLEKNWFLWWDLEGQMYAHYDIGQRAFAQLNWNGTAGENLAPHVASTDEQCVARYVPQVHLSPNQESIHQATNSLSITLCKRKDRWCKPTSSNTYIMTLFHHKITPGLHTTYEPYVMLFQQAAPFAIYGFSQKPLWIHGRARAGERSNSRYGDDEVKRPLDESEMFYMTSINWKGVGRKYHGYIDDEIIIGFGVEDVRAGGIDVLASDLLRDIGLCDQK